MYLYHLRDKIGVALLMELLKHGLSANAVLLKMGWKSHNKRFFSFNVNLYILKIRYI